MTNDFRIKRIVVPYGVVSQLNRPDRYAFLILGHIFNEIMALQRLALMCNLKGSRKRSKAEQAGGTFNSLFILRILSGKLYESSLVINGKEVSSFLKSHCFQHLKFDGVAELRRFNKLASGNKWLNAARNGHSMHYPTLQHAAKALDAMDAGKAGFEFFVGGKHGETLYWSSDVLAGTAFAFEADEKNYGTGLSKIFDDLVELSRILLNITAECLNGFVVHLRHGEDTEYAKKVRVLDVKEFEIPNFSEFEMPYFLIMEKKQDNE